MNASRLLVVVVGLAVALTVVTVVATEPSTQPAGGRRIVDLPVLLSPDAKDYAPAQDPAITKLIEQHNAGEDQLATLLLRGRCVWNLDGSEGQARQMQIQYDRGSAIATMICGQDSCKVEGAKVTAGAESLIHTDALYLLMVRKYNPRGFRSAPAGQIAGKPVIVARSDTETLEFDAQSGRLVRATVQTKAGPVAANFENFAPLVGGKVRAIVPTRVWLSVPDGFFPEGWAVNAKITLTIDPALSELQDPREK